MDFFITKKRGAFLTLLLFWFSFSYISDIFVTNATLVPSWLPFTAFGFSLLRGLIFLVILWGIWFFKKWAVYTFVIAELVLFATILSIPLTPEFESHFAEIPPWVIYLTSLITQTVWIGLLLWAIKRKWNYFK